MGAERERFEHPESSFVIKQDIKRTQHCNSVHPLIRVISFTARPRIVFSEALNPSPSSISVLSSTSNNHLLSVVTRNIGEIVDVTSRTQIVQVLPSTMPGTAT
jgi:hypothetical protein